ncbi:MAG: outer membrane beta-barrel protein [Hydrogenovibrio sp.]|uniref:outer membrane protein n=1 Tax=Hydrogenovibrio sp. TaxID=2065821 RepID=UPI002870235D|nr:outer membrane beta-barrel protein [Hydrogenovibrio sp.]MDR9497812.1 outer membrane beta-barrel protein [Hydrogenovibrio sp.]
MSIKKKYPFVASSIFFVVIPSTSYSSDKALFDGIYGGVNASSSEVSSIQKDSARDLRFKYKADDRESGMGFELGVGRSIDRFFMGVSAQYQNNSLGKAIYKSNNGSLTTIKATKLWHFSVTPGFLITPNFLAYGRLGRGVIEAKAEAADGRSFNDDADVNVYGVGAKYALNQNFSINVEYQKTSGYERSGSLKTEFDQNIVQLGFQYRHCFFQ